MLKIAIAATFVVAGVARADDGFVNLFADDGPPKGWVVTEWSDLAKKAPEGVRWTVKDGVLHAGSQRGTWLMSEKEYADFTLEFEVKLTERGTRGQAVFNLLLRVSMQTKRGFDWTHINY